MGNFWLRMKIWTKTTLFAVLIVYALLFIYENSGEEVHFWWWFGHYGEHDKLTFGFTCFIAGVILTILVRTTYLTLSQVRDMQSRSRNQKVEQDLADMKEKAAKLQTRPTTPATTVPGAFEAPDNRLDETGV
jgi:uncharacterized membrane protein